MTALRLIKSSDQSLPRHGFLLFSLTLVLAWLALAPPARAVLPAPGGGYGMPAYGAGNTAAGQDALFSLNDHGTQNTAIGFHALFSNAGADSNTATGHEALYSNTEGDVNTAIGANTLFDNTTGGANTAIGVSALQSNTTGSFNMALGVGSGLNLTTGNFNIDIGNANPFNLTTTDVEGESGTIRIGHPVLHSATYIAGISGVTVSGAPVVVASDGHLGTADISTLQGPAGPQGPAGVGLVSGAYLTLASTAPAPVGFTLLGTTTITYRDGHNVVHDSTLKLYQKE